MSLIYWINSARARTHQKKKKKRVPASCFLYTSLCCSQFDAKAHKSAATGCGHPTLNPEEDLKDCASASSQSPYCNTDIIGK